MDWKLVGKQLRKGNNEILEIVFTKYGNYCIKKLVKENKCSREDAEDIFIDAVINLREKLLNEKIKNLISPKNYIYKTCYFMLLKRLEESSQNLKKIDALKNYYYDSCYQLDANPVFNPKLLEITMQAWNSLSERCKDIISYFYIDKLDMQSIARNMDLLNSNVAKTTKSRCYKKFVEKGRELRNILEKPEVK